MSNTKAIKPKYPVVYAGPTVKGLHHGAVLRNREALLMAKMRAPENYFEEYIVPLEDMAKAEAQIEEKTGIYHILYKKGASK